MSPSGRPFLFLCRELQRRALELLFPAVCAGCGRWGEDLCDACEATFVGLAQPQCPACGMPLYGADGCERCQRYPLGVDGLRSVYWLQGALRQAVHDFKYRGVTTLGRRLGGLLADFLAGEEMPVQVVVPVPLHRRRQRLRGYNQAQLLADCLAEKHGLVVEEGCLVRLRDTPSQARAGGVEERRSNVAGAFVCRDARLRGVDVLVVDDVCTTGATIDACARALKEGGARRVWGLTLAREPHAGMPDGGGGI